MIACGGWEPTCAAHCASVSKELTCIQVARNETRLRAVEWRTWGLNGKYYDFWCCEDELRPRGSLEVKPSSLGVDCWWQWSRKELVQYQLEALFGQWKCSLGKVLARQEVHFHGDLSKKFWKARTMTSRLWGLFMEVDASGFKNRWWTSIQVVCRIFWSTAGKL